MLNVVCCIFINIYLGLGRMYAQQNRDYVPDFLSHTHTHIHTQSFSFSTD